MLIHFSFEVIDGKNAGSTIELHTIDDIFTFLDCQVAATNMIPILRNIMVGGIGNVRVWADIDWTDLRESFPTLAIPEEYADVEEKGEFVFYDYENHIYRNFIPTLDETLVIPGTRNIDTADIRAAAYISMIQFGVAAGAAEFTFCNIRGEQIGDVKEALETFVPRKRRKNKR